jgi:branched-chain amino acid aminotransferase
MINFNGDLLPEDALPGYNRAFLFGDGVFETIRVASGRILFLEDHYFRLMSAMRIVRMEIPMAFTMEYIESQVMLLVSSQNFENARVRMTVFRNGAGFYLPKERTVSFVIRADEMESPTYSIKKLVYEIDLYKDFYVTAQLLSSVKTTNRMINITGSIYADENGFENCLLMNDSKNVIEALNGNLFMLIGNRLSTPPVSDGCVAGIMRKQVLTAAKKMTDFEVVEESISPFDLQKADELFITNVIMGIQPVTKYRKKEYRSEFAETMVSELNTLVVKTS